MYASKTLQAKQILWQLSPAKLTQEALDNQEGFLTDTGALMCSTGKFTGRSPKDKFTVKDRYTEKAVWWGAINFPMSPFHFDQLHTKMLSFLEDKKVYARYAYAGADSKYKLKLEIYTTKAWHNLFCYNMFLRPTENELSGFDPEFTIICIPEFQADPEKDGTRQSNFTILNVDKKILLIGGTGYAGEIKKGIFSYLNFSLLYERNILPMHCSANQGKKGDTAIFFGLSGTGKTTLSADPNRALIGDDEHGWSEEGVFNFEGGCYAKVIDLSHEKEPEIFEAIREGSIVENTIFKPNSSTVDYTNKSLTENTRTAYPIHYIPNALPISKGGVPENIFFLTADAFGVLPPISKLDMGQAMFHFISGFTSKLAGTEMGVIEPQPTFSACFGEAFLPLHPTEYAKKLGENIHKNKVNVWMINTGWTGGGYGVGSRMKLVYTRSMITAALEGKLDAVSYEKHSVFGVQIPTSCPDVPSEILNPKNTWKNAEEYETQALQLAQLFLENFKKYADFSTEEIKNGAPIVK